MKKRGNLRKNIYVHLGYPKTATKTLQAHYFPYLKDIEYLGKFGKNDNFKIIKIDKKILLDLYHGRVQKIIKYKKKFSQSFYNDLKKPSALISAEGLTMNSLRFIKDTSYNHMKLVSIHEVIDAIKTLFDSSLFDLKVILVTRRQIELIPSLYSQSYKESYIKIKLINTFKKFVDHILSDKNHSLSDYFDYTILARILEKEFNIKNILILPFEKFEREKKSFLNDITNFMSTSFENSAFNSTQIENKSIIKFSKKKYYEFSFSEIIDLNPSQYNKVKSLFLFNYFSAFLKLLILNSKNPGPTIFSDDQKKIIFEKFKNSNELLSKKYNLNLDNYGYF